ncbi:hypothetical protein GCM10009802_46940 [Streptomyces synnematoformans]|uniref:Uncharacterized protein n=1 Tax=Streptomyces synnematoformans TaxID=415721 RepID=A0ABN2Z6W9_9ACTN
MLDFLGEAAEPDPLDSRRVEDRSWQEQYDMIGWVWPSATSHRHGLRPGDVWRRRSIQVRRQACATAPPRETVKERHRRNHTRGYDKTLAKRMRRRCAGDPGTGQQPLFGS